MRRSLPGTLEYEEVKRFQDDFSFYFSLREYRCMKSSPGLERRYRMLEMLESFLNDEMGPSQSKAPQFYGVKAPIYPKSQKPSKLCPLVCVGNPYTWIIPKYPIKTILCLVLDFLGIFPPSNRSRNPAITGGLFASQSSTCQWEKAKQRGHRREKMKAEWWFQWFPWFFHFYPYSMKYPNLTHNIFSNWVETTNNWQLGDKRSLWITSRVIIHRVQRGVARWKEPWMM